MFRNLTQFITEEVSLELVDEVEPGNASLPIAVCAVLYQAAGSDKRPGGVELSNIVTQISETFNLTEEGASELLQMTEILLRNPGKNEELILTLKEKLSADQKLKLLTMTWKVILADKTISHEENRIAITIRQLLGMSLEQGILGRELAEESIKAAKSTQDPF